MMTCMSMTYSYGACMQEKAIYIEPKSGTKIEFRDDYGSFVVTNSFRMAVPEGPVFDGIVLWNNGVSRANTLLQLDCPDGDVVSEELDVCTKWEGVMYTVSDDGMVYMIGTDEAANKLLMPDLSRQLYYSDEFESIRAHLPAFDVFELDSCQE